ncbi:treslin isoform X2 [Anolis carolinensis]|uniref:treslin isoform X2 n=1 Tax=Anolis carolinensis TaxID=28377 RepID=UPI002F2B2F9F
MTGCHNVVFLLDTASSLEKSHLSLGVLRILNFLGCKFGLSRVRWGFKFFDSLGTQGRTSQVGSFHELGSRSWEDFEEAAEARFGGRIRSPRLPGPVPRATLTQNILKEALLDYQWDRPEIASPTKLFLRSQKNKLTVTLDKLPSSSSCEDFENAIFLFSPCPRSQRDLLQFAFGSYVHVSDELPPFHDVTDKFIPKGIQEMMLSQKITLYWVDTTEPMKLLESPDCMGYRLLSDLMLLLGGTILPSENFIHYLNHQRGGTVSAVPVKFWDAEPALNKTLPFDSSLNCLFSLPSVLQATFPPLEGVLFLRTDEIGEVQSCAVTLEPLTLSQQCFKGPVNISLKCAVTGWNAVHIESFYAESWILRSTSSRPSCKEPSLFQQFMKYILAQGLHLVAEVYQFGASSPCTGIFSPISDSTAILSHLSAEQAPEVETFLLQTTRECHVTKDDDLRVREIVSNVFNQGCDDLERNHMGSAECQEEASFPEWAQQELSRTPCWSPAVMEGWYSLSNFCGASSHLMESFRLLLADSATEEEEASKPEAELTHCLSEFYQRRVSDQSAASRQQDHRKRRKLPRTPVRQKMKTMPRSLQMLNVARLNVKAQKFQPEGEPPISEKASQGLLSKPSEDNVNGKGRTAKSFRTEEEMLSYITTNYQKAAIDGENLLTHAQDMVATVNIFQKLNEAAFLDTVKSSLLKTSKALRQQLGSDPDQEAKIKECQLQVYLRLEMCRQCPSLQNNIDGMDQLVEELTEMLRILCLTKDPGYLTRFLEEVVDVYMETMPKILGDLYYSLGTQIPAKLASVLPADFFSDDSMSQDSQAPSVHPSASSVPVSSIVSLSTEAEQLEELRTRSAKKRKNTLARHRSVTETSQNLRQIEIPQVPKHRARKDNSYACLDVKSAPAPQKAAGQEVTKVRRTLFNENILSPGKRSLAKMSRSRSVSALEGLKHKRSHSKESPRENQTLLTKTVPETPLHKQISRRQLYKQIKGRCSDPGPDVGIVEESPEKSTTFTLRRSPRIKHLFLDRTLSGSFHPSQRSERNTPRMQSLHLESPGSALPSARKAVQSPKSLLFGAVLEEFSLGGMHSQTPEREPSAFDEPALYQTPRKSPLQSPQRLVTPPGQGLRRSPRLQEKQPQAAQKSPVPKCAAAKGLRNVFSPPKQKDKSLPEYVEKEENDPGQPMERLSSSTELPKLQILGRQATQEEALDDVFASPPGSCDSAALLPAAVPPVPLNSSGKSFSKLKSLRRSLRATQKIASPQKHSLDPEGVLYLEPHLPLELDSLKAAATVFGEALSGQPVSPKSARLTEAFSAPDRSPALPQVTSPPCNHREATCTVSPPRNQELARKSHLPGGFSLRSQNVRDSSPPKRLESASSRPEEHLLMCGKNEKEQNGGSSSDETHTFCKPGHRENAFLGQSHRQTNRIMMQSQRRVFERCSSPGLNKTQRIFKDVIVVCEELDISSVLNKALPSSSQGDQGPGASCGGAKKAITGKEEQIPPVHSEPALPTATKAGSCAYALRCTPDRRQREAEARLGNPEKVVRAGAPRTTYYPAPAAASAPTYEVELEMKASGLPKLRIKRVSSVTAPEVPPPEVPGKAQTEDESDLAARDLSGTSSGKSETASISPPCTHSTHSTPGKFGGGQTYICQSYTPTHCCTSAYTCSPSQGSGLPWTPSPKHKGKVTPEAIKDWPRRKKASMGSRKRERLAEAEVATHNAAGMGTSELLSGNKVLHQGEFELEGVSSLLDESTCSDTEPSGDENICSGASQLKSRKRTFENVSPEKEKGLGAKKSCPKREHPGAAAFMAEQSIEEGVESTDRAILEEEAFSVMTPPKSSGKGTVSASGLRALAQSPLLYQGCAPSSLRKCATGDDADVFGGANEDSSPFRHAGTRQRSVRTYSRKRLLT